MAEGDNQPTPPPAPPAPPVTDALQQLDTWAKSIGASEKSQGKTQALRELAETLGMTIEDAKKFIDDAKAKEREGMAEADRKLAEATDKLTAAERRSAEADTRELNAEVRAQLIESGMTRAQAAQAVDLVKVDVKDWDEAKVTEAIEATKKAWPQLFPQEEDDKNEDGTPKVKEEGKPPDSKPRGNPPAPAGGGQTSQDKARARVLQRHPDKVKSAT